jgi:hypothetical protein
MKKNPFLKDVKPLSRQQLKEIKGGATSQGADACIAKGEPCGPTINVCCPDLECVYGRASLIGTCKAA